MNDAGGGLRALTRDAVRSRIADEALQLFEEQGFDATTVDDIASAVKISPRSFFRYFPNKEDVVIGDLMAGGTRLRDNVERHLITETPWRALRLAMQDAAAAIDADPTRWTRIVRVINSAASLRARNLEKHLSWSALLIPLIVERLAPEHGSAELAAHSLVSTSFACLDSALATWADGGARESFRSVIDAAFDAVERGSAS